MLDTPTKPKPRSAPESLLAELAARFADRFSCAEAVRRQHAHNFTWYDNQPPDAVVFATSGAEVQDIVRQCAAHRVPIIPFGTGTSLEAQLNAPVGGVSIDLSRMNAILAVRPQDLDCTIEPGVTRTQLNSFIRDQGLFFPIDPGADASLGGMAATRASGTNAVRYGTMKDIVLSLAAVMPNGELIRTARRAKKTSAGYDLTRLLIGSEGTLGIITELTLRLHPIPEAIAAAVCGFASLGGAVESAMMAIQAGIPVARIEMLDALQIHACNLYSKLTLAEVPTLFVEFHGSQREVDEQVAQFEEIAREHGGTDFNFASKAEDRSKLWQARHDAAYASLALRPGAKAVATDACVPISRLAECVLETKADLDRERLVGTMLGHVGDGNFHVALLADPADADEIKRAKGFIERLAMRAIAMDGTCTGEHGVGQGKIHYLQAEHGAALDAMRAIKQAIDPDNIMNPGKIFAV
ncbi:MAG: FAD-binding protein [Xanthobacteraceae bacterium]|nr:FAD-binding protein [Xanthobacteraceae bacterium]